MPDQPGGQRDQITVLGRPRRSGQDHHAIAGRGGDAGRIARQDLVQQVTGVGGQVRVGPEEHAQQVPAADDPGQRPVRAHHRQPPQTASAHLPRRPRDRRVRVGRDGRRRHQLPRDEPPPARVTGGSGQPAAACRIHPGPARVFVLDRRQIGLRHHAHDMTAHGHHRHAADLVFIQ
jgi:hypothetical protein